MSETYSPGLEGVVAGETAVSTVETGLTYRGYTIEDLAANSNYEEVAYLVLHGELPTAAEAKAFRERLGAAATVPAEIIATLRSIPHSASTMDVLRSAASLLAHWEPEVNDNSHAANVRKTERLIAKMPIIVAARQRLKDGKEPVAADPQLPLPANFLWMLRGEKPSARQVKALDVSLILYAEHEFNASAFAARCVVSTLSDLHSAITAGIGALKGPLHGGANERAMEVLQEVSSPAEAEGWIRNALANKRRIMGFGHRVYKDGDPRAVFLKTLTQEVAKETGHDDMEQTAEIIETIVRNEKKLPPNVDWPCARLYHYLGLPIDLYTPLFVVARVVGWSAHAIEQLDNNRLIRPRAIYNGVAERKWKPVGER
ncbi:citrate/2-methylcitrate synthase [Anatilimnocola floriformis]|uniref:citrate/2-methylcitrate synthase n=1 Tax=Anatilimnocola floriformis TaxID=2948575 RepID=UPI0020C51A43|nr:citrate/2-methylcitrate synthase [Anatilimnocola floriformis]